LLRRDAQSRYSLQSQAFQNILATPVGIFITIGAIFHGLNASVMQCSEQAACLLICINF